MTKIPNWVIMCIFNELRYPYSKFEKDLKNISWIIARTNSHVPKSPSGSLCPYLMSCDTHIRNYLNHCPPKHSWQVWKRFEKIFIELSRRQATRTDTETQALTIPLRPASQRGDKPSKIKFPDINNDIFVYVPSQWESALHCNAVSYWLGTQNDLCINNCWYQQFSLNCWYHINNMKWIVANNNPFPDINRSEGSFCVCVQPMGDNVTL